MQVDKATFDRMPEHLQALFELKHDPDCSAGMLDDMSGKLKSGKPGIRRKPHKTTSMSGRLGLTGRQESGIGDSGGASRFFYCAKASASERNAGLEGFEEKPRKIHIRQTNDGKRKLGGKVETFPCANHHPTVKPIDLCRYLAKLIRPPFEDAKLLVPFSGSGSEMIGAYKAGWNNITGIEIDPEYIKIAEARIKHHTAQQRLSF